MRGLFVGRFQPLHRGHVAALRAIRGDLDHLVVVIGSAQYSHNLENPFTAGERVWMLTDALRDEGLDVTVVPVVDIHRNSLWVSHIETYVPRFDVVYTNNPLPQRLFRERGYDVREFPLIERKRYEASTVRQMMLDGGPWQDLLPGPVVRIITEIDGVQRLRDVGRTDASTGEIAGRPPYDQRR